jgi:hypothetical protein
LSEVNRSWFSESDRTNIKDDPSAPYIFSDVRTIRDVPGSGDINFMYSGDGRTYLIFPSLTANPEERNRLIYTAFNEQTGELGNIQELRTKRRFYQFTIVSNLGKEPSLVILPADNSQPLEIYEFSKGYFTPLKSDIILPALRIVAGEIQTDSGKKDVLFYFGRKNKKDNSIGELQASELELDPLRRVTSRTIKVYNPNSENPNQGIVRNCPFTRRLTYSLGDLILDPSGMGGSQEVFRIEGNSPMGIEVSCLERKFGEFNVPYQTFSVDLPSRDLPHLNIPMVGTKGNNFIYFFNPNTDTVNLARLSSCYNLGDISKQVTPQLVGSTISSGALGFPIVRGKRRFAVAAREGSRLHYVLGRSCSE